MSRATPVVGSTPERRNPDGSILGEPEVRARCADCHAPAWIRVSQVKRARCPACHDAFEAQYRPDLTVLDGDGDATEQLHLPVLELVDGDAS